MPGKKLNPKKLTLVLLKVDSTDALGRPKTLTLLDDDEKIALKGGEAFVTAYVDKSVMQGKRPTAQA